MKGLWLVAALLLLVAIPFVAMYEYRSKDEPGYIPAMVDRMTAQVCVCRTTACAHRRFERQRKLATSGVDARPAGYGRMAAALMRSQHCIKDIRLHAAPPKTKTHSARDSQ